MGKVSTTLRSLNLLKEMGWMPDIVERRLTGKVTKDFLEFADIIAVNPDDWPTTLAVQATSASNTSARVNKLLAAPGMLRCLEAGWGVEVWGWRDVPARDGTDFVARSLIINDLGELKVVLTSFALEAHEERIRIHG